MGAPVIIALPGNETLARGLAQATNAEVALAEFRRFPDGESYVRIDTPMGGRTVLVVCTLDRPDNKFLTLMFTATTARELGATKIGLVAPYLGYLRQDKRFKPGEALTSALFARLLSGAFDWLVTIDPHLHRLPALDSVYSVPCRVLHAAPLVAQWIARNVPRPLLIGPDEESEQWVSKIAAACAAPFIVLEKRRLGDQAVELSVPVLDHWRSHTPVLVDDIISSARTMIEAASRMRSLSERIVCIGVHGVFGASAYEALKAAGAQVVTTNTIPHETNAIDVTSLLAEAIRGNHSLRPSVLDTF